MRPFINALVFVPGGPTDPALQHARRIAVAHGASITVADVLTQPPAYQRALLRRQWKTTFSEMLRARKTATLERVAARLRRVGVESRIRVLEGSPVRALVREVVQAHHDLLAVAASAPGAIHSAGTTAKRLVRECPCPTLLARPSRRRRHRVLVAIDTQPSSRSHATFNALLLETAIAVAKLEQADLHVLHAWELSDQRYRRRQGLTAAETAQLVMKAREAALEALQRTIAPYRRHLPAKQVHLERGAPKQVISTVAVKHGIDLLVIGTVARSGLARHLIGNTAEALLAGMPCSMLVVRPERPARARG
jgi:nucleotide-binding universal stress UspA family protein